MPLQGVITYVNSPEVVAKEFRKIVKEELKEIPNLWHDKYLPNKFKNGARTKYGLKPRSRKYDARKLRKQGHTRALEYSGELKRTLLREITITGTSKGVRGRMKGTVYLNKYRKDYKRPDKYQEIIKTLKIELNELAFSLHDAVTDKIKMLNVKKKIVI